MLTRKIYLTILFYLILINSVIAQFDIRLTSAFGKMALNPITDLNMHSDAENFLTAGLQIDYYISEHFGIGIGADYYILDSKFDVILSDYDHKYDGIDNWEGDPVPREYEFTIRSNAPDIVEQNTMSFIDFPLSATYRYPINSKLKLVARLGLKLGVPLTDSYRLNQSDLFTRLYFEVWDLELFEIPAHGLYDNRTDWHPEGELNLNMVYSVFSELGIDFHVSMLKVRISGYFSYGLNDMINEHETSLVYWREDYNNVLSLAESVSMMQFGVKTGIGFLKKRDRVRKQFKYKRRAKCSSVWTL